MTSEGQDRLLDELLKECKSPEDILGKHGLLRRLTQRAVGRALAVQPRGLSAFTGGYLIAVNADR
jgi:hypothetical protein